MARKDSRCRLFIGYPHWIKQKVSPTVTPHKGIIVKLFLGIIFSIFGVFLAACTAGFFMPATLEIERSTVVNAYAEDIFPLLNDLKAYESWAALDARLEGASILTGGAESGVGQTQVWQNGPKGVESGSREIMQEAPSEFVQIQVSVNGQVTTTTHAILKMDTGPVTVLTKREIPQPGFPYVGRLRSIVIKSRIENNLDEALARLKTHIEANYSR